jgi:N-sulfoglucosamine sulfohydrolase
MPRSKAARLCRFITTMATALLLSSSFVSAAERPNILWIIAEDMGPELGCYGHPEVHSPVIDKLAADGVRYTRAFTVTPVCSTSRSSFMTGMYAHSIGAHNHRSHRKDGFKLENGVRVITDWFRPAGYQTANIRTFPTDNPDPKFFNGTGKTDWNFSYLSPNENKTPFDTANWDQLKGKQPFFAQINFPETHRGGAWNNAHKYIDRPANPDKVKAPPYYPDHPLTRADWAQYLNTVMALDKKVGFVLDKLERDGLADNTVVFFIGDHGRAMVRGKQWPYDSGLNVPMIIRWPKNFPAPNDFHPGTVDDRIVASIDWSATVLDIAGIAKPAKMQGRIFLGENDEGEREHAFAGRDRGDETVDFIRTIRSKQFRYIRNFYPNRGFTQLNRYKENSYPVLRLMHRLHDEGTLSGAPAALMTSTRPKEEFYDIDADPYEINNLADSTKHQQELRKLRQALDTWMDKIDDKGRIPETPETIAVHEEAMKKAYTIRLEEQSKYESEHGIQLIAPKELTNRIKRLRR